MGRRRFKPIAVAGAAVALSVVAIGVLHTPYGRPLMRRWGMRCPARDVSPAAAEALRLRGAHALRGDRPAPARPALGLDLDRADLDGARGWAAARRGSCTTRERPSSSLICRNVAGYDEVTFGFAPDGRLISAATFRQGLPAAAAARLFRQIQDGLAARLGGAGDLAGDPAADALGAGALRVARLQHRFSDYLATVTAMNLPGGIALREQYQSAR